MGGVIGSINFIVNNCLCEDCNCDQETDLGQKYKRDLTVLYERSENSSTDESLTIYNQDLSNITNINLDERALKEENEMLLNTINVYKALLGKEKDEKELNYNDYSTIKLNRILKHNLRDLEKEYEI